MTKKTARKKFFSKLLFRAQESEPRIFYTDDRTLGYSFEEVSGIFEFETDFDNREEMQLVGVYPDKLIYQQVKGVVTLVIRNTESQIA